MTTPATLSRSIQRIDAHIASQQWDEARPLAEALVEQAPTVPGVLERSILVLRQQEDWAALSQVLLQARNQYQLWPQGSDLLMGQAMVELQDWSRAIPYLELALEQEANAGWAHHFLGKALRHTGRLNEGLALQQQATALLPGFAWAPFEAAQLLLELERSAEAILELQEARQRLSEPDPVVEREWQRLQPLVLRHQAEALIRSGEREQAFSVLRRALAQQPDDTALQQLLTDLLLVDPTDDLTAIDRELASIEALLDQLEAAHHASATTRQDDLSYL